MQKVGGAQITKKLWSPLLIGGSILYPFFHFLLIFFVFIIENFLIRLRCLQLFDKIIFDDYQQPIPLATSNVVEKQKAIISGWGVTEKGVVEDQLKVAEFTVQRFCKDRADKFCVKGSSSDGICRV